MDISKETKNALHKMIHQSAGVSPKDVADVLGVSHKTVLNYANPNMDMHLPSLKAFEAALIYTQNPANLKVWAHKLGYMLVPVQQADEKDHQVSVLESLLQVNIQSGQINQHAYNILEDGVITPSELSDTLQIVDAIQSALTIFKQAVEKEAAVYLSSLQTEKA